MRSEEVGPINAKLLLFCTPSSLRKGICDELFAA